MKKLLIGSGLVLLLLAAVVAARTATFSSRQLDVEPAPTIALDTAALAERLAGALRFRTVSHEEVPTIREPEEFAGLRAYLAEQFPRVHAALEQELVAGHSLLYTWAGAEPGREPILLMGHMDVVPVEAGTEEEWTHPPFDGYIGNGHIWGRGALDNKVGVLGALEAVEGLLAEGYRPERTIYLAFGHDEEVGGTEGAAVTAELLRSRGIRPAFVLDEGGVIVRGALPLEAPVAVVGIADKGRVSLQLTARGEGGHSSLPPRQTAVGVLSTAIHRLQENPFPGGLRGPTRKMFSYIGPEMDWPERAFFANLWLFGPLIERQLAADPSTDATLRTTTAPTMFEGSPRENVLPTQARAVVNFRIYSGETVQSVMERVRRVVDDSQTTIEPLGTPRDPSAVSPTDASV